MKEEILVYHYSYEDEFEADAFFDKDLNIITAWSCNDANWRGEYMEGLIEYFGGEIKNFPKGNKSHAIKQIHKWFGYIDEEESEEE